MATCNSFPPFHAHGREPRPGASSECTSPPADRFGQRAPTADSGQVPDVEARARLASVMELSQDAIVGSDKTGRIISWNRAAEALFGWTEAEAVGNSVSLIYPPELTHEFHEIADAIRSGQSLVQRQTVRMCKDGRRIRVTITVSAIRDGSGDLVGYSGIVREDCDRTQLERRLHQSQKMEAVGRLADGVAHDFNNLLTVVNGYSELLLRQLPLDPRSRELVGLIRLAGEKAAVLTHQLLAFSRHQAVDPVTLDLNEVVADIEKLLRRTLGEDIDLATSPAPDLWPVLADQGQIEQVLMNLAINARDAMPEGGKLTVETRNVELGVAYAAGRSDVRSGGYVLLAVSDTGCGMSQEVRSRIFEPFFTTKEAGKGTGLGLATVYGIVKQARGHVEVYSELGYGTTFKVYLPRAQGVTLSANSSAELRQAPRGSEAVLLVEDDPAVRTLARQALEDAGYRVVEAGDEAPRLERGGGVSGDPRHPGHGFGHAAHEWTRAGRKTSGPPGRPRGSFPLRLRRQRRCAPRDHREPGAFPAKADHTYGPMPKDS